MKQRLSEPKLKLEDVRSLAEGNYPQDPNLVINSLSLPTLDIKVNYLLEGRKANLRDKYNESIIYIIDGSGNYNQTSHHEDNSYSLAKDDFGFSPYGVKSSIENDGDGIMKYITCDGVVLNKNNILERSKELYGTDDITEDIDRKKVKVIKSAERDIYSHGHRAEKDNSVNPVERGPQYPNCGARTLGSVKMKQDGSSTPHWQNFDEVRYILTNEVKDYHGPAGEEEIINVSAGDLIYIPSRVRHHQTALPESEFVAFWGFTLAAWNPDMEGGEYGNYDPDGLIYREGDEDL